MELIKCPECGEGLSCDALFCVKCGTRIEVDSCVNGKTEKSLGFFARNKKKIGIGIGAVLGILAVLFIINLVQARNLKKELMRDWSRIEGEEDSYILCILDFSEDDIQYKIETGYAWMDMTIDVFDYKVISGNKMKVSMFGSDWETVTVEFNEDKTMMKVKPALTSVANEEYWFNLE